MTGRPTARAAAHHERTTNARREHREHHARSETPRLRARRRTGRPTTRAAAHHERTTSAPRAHHERTTNATRRPTRLGHCAPSAAAVGPPRADPRADQQPRALLAPSATSPGPGSPDRRPVAPSHRRPQPAAPRDRRPRSPAGGPTPPSAGRAASQLIARNGRGVRAIVPRRPASSRRRPHHRPHARTIVSRPQAVRRPVARARDDDHDLRTTATTTTTARRDDQEDQRRPEARVHVVRVLGVASSSSPSPRPRRRRALPRRSRRADHNARVFATRVDHVLRRPTLASTTSARLRVCASAAARGSRGPRGPRRARGGGSGLAAPRWSCALVLAVQVAKEEIELLSRKIKNGMCKTVIV
nr:MAG: hypothetical protein [Apis mellifera filamentous virus]